MDYKEKQQKFRDMRKYSGTFTWVSREVGDIKGRTYKKTTEEDLLKLQKEVKSEESKGE